MKRLTFKKGINKILVPRMIQDDLINLIAKETQYFLKRYKINKDARIEFNYSGGIFYEIIVKK